MQHMIGPRHGLLLLVVLLALVGCRSPEPVIEPPPTDTSPPPQPEPYDPVDPLGGAEVHYRLYPSSSDEPALTVELHFQARDQTSTRLLLPNNWANVQGFHRGLRDFSVLDEHQRIEPTDEEHVFVVHHKPDALIGVRYEVFQTFETDLFENRYRPVFADDHFYFLGRAVFVWPDRDQDRVRAIRLTLDDFPDDWQILHSLQSQPGGGLLDISLDTVRNTLFFAGEPRVHIQKSAADTAPITIVTRGDWPFSLEEFASITERIVEAQFELFEEERPPLLFSLYPGEPGCCTHAGTALFHTKSLFLSLTKDRFQWPPLLRLLSHETFHHFNGLLIRRATPRGEYLWFSEGFTDYYASLILLRAGLITLPEHIQDRNRQIRRYRSSPVINATNDELANSYRSTNFFNRLPYLRGALLALRWDALIRDATDSQSSLDDLMRQALSRAHEGEAFSFDILDEILADYPMDSTDIQRFVLAGETIENPENLGPCVRLENHPAGPLNPGFDFSETLQTGVIRGVDPGGPAYEAGVREGQILLGMDLPGIGTMAIAEIALTIQYDDTATREIRYVPYTTSEELRLYRLDQELFEEDPATCLAFFGAELPPAEPEPEMAPEP